MDVMTQSSELPLSCSCGAVELLVSGSPVARAYCHCSSCREFYGFPVLAATAWKNDVVRVSKGLGLLGKYKHPTKQMQRHFCLACGTTMFGANRLGLTVIHNSLIAKAWGGLLPDALTPEFHLFYAYREFDIDDELPKYLEGRDGPLFSSSEPSEA